MKKIFLFLVTAFILLNSSFAQVNYWSRLSGVYSGGYSYTSFTKTNNGSVFVSTAKHGIYRSDDNGLTWMAKDSGMKTSNIRNIMSFGTILVAQSDTGIYKSADNGDSWQSIQLNLGFYNKISDVAVSEDGIIYMIVTNNGIFKSNDTGNSWNNISGILSTSNLSCIGVSKMGSVFVGVSGIMYRSIDKGDNWNPTRFSVMNHFYAVDDSTLIASFNDGVYLSVNDGVTWKYSGNGLDESVIALSFANSNSGKLYAGLEAGLYESSDRGQNWNIVSGGMDNSLQVPCVIVVPNGNIIAGTNNGLFISKNDGVSWEVLKSSFYTYPNLSKVLVGNDNVLYSFDNTLFSKLINLYVSTDSGNSWLLKPLNNNPLGMLLTKKNDLIIWTDSSLILISTDIGGTWNPRKTGIMDTTGISTMARDSVGNLYVSFADGSIYTTSNDGTNWDEIITGLPKVLHNTIVASPWGKVYTSSGTNLYTFNSQSKSWSMNTGWKDSVSITRLRTGADGSFYAVTNALSASVSRSLDSGKTWTALNNFPNITEPTSMVVSQYGYIYVSTLNSGVYMSQNKGENWEQVNTGLLSTDVMSLGADSKGNIYAATDMGMFFHLQPVVSVENIDMPSFNSTVYPNPASNFAKIEFSLPFNAELDISIFDLDGIRLEKITSGFYESGTYKINFNLNEFSSGIYFVKCIAGTRTFTNKLVIAK